MPLVYNHHADPRTPIELERIFRGFSALAVLFCAGLGLLAPEILMVLTTPVYYEAARVVPILTPAVLLAGMYVFAPGLAIVKRTKTIALLNALGAGLNLGGNIVLVPVLGIRGAALSTLVSAGLIFVLYMRHSQRHYPVPHGWAGLGIAAGAVGALSVPTVLGWQLPVPLAAAIGIKLAAFALLALLLVRLRVVQRAEIAWAMGAARQVLARRRMLHAPESTRSGR
jgi:O-antigen/teichoic acid export membrane protein